ncbi:MAG: SDR family NAD(P)-dependent oxidoreductase [Alphaproteobacteria bacterium]|nr:SDR family NAD(P)-dependent oxidoreductase [Alphaproteobacteria bacterium]MDE2012572.1 SDR family NAD(P)-dependent oxidoreductase [Alphaproteobacteria bacterium]MDE2073437.1 SDR family NAD(P)-dependent oxidoreductase [Alphaproteobacteria bacterium]MDE2350947.1 SDR family NAD(P)-dependent oxidoreductase [Alphaproteobacteria bacterium]
MNYDLKGRTAFVTGATSGLGRRFARVLAQAGADIAIAGRRAERLATVKSEIEALGGKCAAVPLDVTDIGAISHAFDTAEGALGPIGILVNNAGMSREGLAVTVTPGDFDAVMGTNLRAPFFLATEAARRMIAQGKGGRIVNIASIAAFRVLPGVSTYCISKAGLAMMTQSLAREWARYEINVNAICPGFIETEINRDWFQTEAGQKQIRSFPRRRLAQESDLDGLLLLLASDASRAITGSLMTVDDAQSL